MSIQRARTGGSPQSPRDEASDADGTIAHWIDMAVPPQTQKTRPAVGTAFNILSNPRDSVNSRSSETATIPAKVL